MKMLFSSFSILHFLSLFTTGSSEAVDAALVSLLRKVKVDMPDFSPNAVIDVGANAGEWSKALRDLFPGAKLLLVEASPMHNATLAKVVKDIGKAEHFIGVFSATEGEVVEFYQGENTGNSMFRENSEHYANDKPVQRITRTLDNEIASSFLRNEIIDVIKADVQGAELAVFQGATKALSQATFVYFEASTIEYNEGAPCFYQVDAFLRGQGYFFYDIGGLHYNPAFKTYGLGQYDVLYVRPDSPRLPQKMREAGAKFCGHGTALAHVNRESGTTHATSSSSFFSSWMIGFSCFLCGLFLDAALMRFKKFRTKKVATTLR